MANNGDEKGSRSIRALEIVEATLAQYGDVAKISDTRVATDLIKQLELEKN